MIYHSLEYLDPNFRASKKEELLRLQSASPELIAKLAISLSDLGIRHKASLHSSDQALDARARFEIRIPISETDRLRSHHPEALDNPISPEQAEFVRWTCLLAVSTMNPLSGRVRADFCRAMIRRATAKLRSLDQPDP